MQQGYVGAERPALSDLDKCTRCGLCEQACPTYRLLHFEPDSPRGRIFLMKEVAEGRAGVDEHLAQHLYRCLGCRACETACPSGVPFGRLLELGRHQVELHGEISPARRTFRRFRTLAFERVLAQPKLFRLAMAPARLIQRVPGLRAALEVLPLPARLRQIVRMIPKARANAPRPLHNVERAIAPGATFPAHGPRRARVGLFVGCVMGSLFESVHAATVLALTRSGCEVVVAGGQWCCGALNLHAGERVIAARMAGGNVAAFAAQSLDAIVVNSAGCGAAMKEYGDLLPREDAAADFAAKVRDATELLFQLGLGPGLGPLPLRVTYQDACHLAHAQRIRSQPRSLLARIPQLDYVEMAGADRCCGAAGVYNLTQPELSSAILAEKLDAVAATRASGVATTNPGCAMQLQAGIAARRLDVQVQHVMELVALSYAAGDRHAER